MIEYGQEHYSQELIEELKPLLAKNWTASESKKDGRELNPDFDKYRQLDAMGLVLCLTARQFGTLIGYCVYFIGPTILHKGMVVAHGNAIYVDPKFPEAPRILLRLAENIMVAHGVSGAGWFVPPGGHFHAFLKGLGFADDEVLMEKRFTHVSIN